MVTTLHIGLQHISEHIVTREDTALNYGSGFLEVFATPSMIALMENSAMKAVQNQLPDGYGTVGIEINVKHIKATPIGMKVKSEAILTEINDKRLTFLLKAWDEQGEIGLGNHTRYIVDNVKFMEKVKGFR
jgi:predicted thioesterase